MEISIKDYESVVHFYYNILKQPRIQVLSDLDKVLLASYGVIGEMGEVFDLIKKYHFNHNKPLPTRAEFVEELGDLLWYIALGLSICPNRDIERDTKELLSTTKDNPSQPVASLLSLQSSLFRQCLKLESLKTRPRRLSAWVHEYFSDPLDKFYNSFLKFPFLVGFVNSKIDILKDSPINLDEICRYNIAKLKARYLDEV